jgi:hypothetical protein
VAGAFAAAKMGVEIIEVLREQHAGDSGGARRLLEGRVIFRKEVLALVLPEENGTHLVAVVRPAFDGTLEKILKRALNEDAGVAEILHRKIKNNYSAIENHLGGQNALGAKEFVDVA